MRAVPGQRQRAGGVRAMILTRRTFLGTGLALIAAPAIVRASSLMPVRTFKASDFLTDAYAWRIQFREILLHGTNAVYGKMDWSVLEDPRTWSPSL